MPNFSITNYSSQSEEIKRIALKFYEWALDHNINRYSFPHLAFK